MRRFTARSERSRVAAALAWALLSSAALAQGDGKRAGNLAEKHSGAMSAQTLREALGQNRMVWVSAPRAGKPPTIDGTLRLEQGEWADAAAVPGMLAPTGGRVLPLRSLTLITWDETSFYLGMRTEVKPGYVLRRKGRDMDNEVSHDDVVELFFNPLGRDQPEPAIFQIMYNALGFRWDAMQTVGVTAKYWDADTWEFKSDYKPGMTHWDLEVRIPVKSLRMMGPNRSGDCWLFLATRDWKGLIDEKSSPQWNIYSSLTGNGGFISQENQFPLVLDDSAPVVQLLDISDLWQGRFGFNARFANTTAKPQTFTALASVYDNSGYQGRDKDWTEREKPLATQSKEFTLKPGEAVEWAIPAATLPELAADPAKRAAPLHGFVFKVSRVGSATPLFVRQCDFAKLEYTARQVTPGYAMDIAYNPVRNNLMPSCDILDHPDPTKVKGLRVELPPLLDRLVTRVSHSIISDLLPLPELKPGKYPARLTLLDTDGRAIETRELTVEKLDEAAIFPWWDSQAGLSDKPIPPHQPMRVEGNAIVTTTGRATFDGRAMPTQVQMTGKDLLAAPVRLTASAGGKPVAFAADAAPKFGRQSPTEVELSGALRSDALNVKIANHMEYDGAQWVTLDVEPAAAGLNLDYLRLEVPFKPERAQFLYTMAMAGRESWVAQGLTQDEGKVWDSAKCRGLGMTVGSFMPQYVVSDSLRGLCWYADNDRGWVPTDDVPATEALRQSGETVLRLNLIGKPFTFRGPRRVQFGLLGLPARPFPAGARIVERRTSQFGHYVGDKVMNFSAPMPRDFAKARDFMEKGTLYDARTYEPLPKAVAKDWLMEFAPWHDSHTPWRTPDLDPRTYDYLAREFDGYGFVPKLANLRAWQWERYVRAAPIDGIYYDTPEGMGFSRSVQNGVAYVLPADQPRGGEVQGGYNISGSREQIKRIATVFHQNGVDNPWVEMHSTHGPVVPATGFLNVLIDGEDFRRPSFRNFMYAWPVRHLRAIDSPSLYGMTIRWLGGYPWDNQTRNVDPLRCQMAALFVHDVWTPGFGSWSQQTIAGKGVLIQKCDREPPYGFRNPDMAAKLIGLGMNLAEAQFLPYWNNADALTLTLQDGKPAAEVRASAWLVPSQGRLIVAVANWNEATVRCRLRVAIAKLGVPDGETIVSDLETDKVLAHGKAVDAFDFDVLPLDFRLFMVTAANPAPLPEALAKMADANLAAKLLILGISAADVQPVPAADNSVTFIGVDGCALAAWRIPSQKRLIVAVSNPGAKAADGKLKLDLDKLGLMPADNGECILVSDIATDKVLLKTTGRNRGKLLGLWKGLRDAEDRKINSPHDAVNISVPAGARALFMVATQ
ncbi:MAG: hypothetical protein FJ291_06380 [Planctomycetes bacterium]|nr:hypothetical protein [Planctomycetota bacterium]